MGKTAIESLDQHIGKRLRMLRNQLGLSMEAIGEFLEVGPQQISRLELGQRRLTVSNLYRIARGLNVPLSFFLEGYKESKNELARLRSFMKTDPEKWQAQTDEELEQSLLAAWRQLPTRKQKESALKMIESVAFPE